MDSRVRIFVGAYGSGKTEVAVHVAFDLAATAGRVAIADLDIVNPFFRSRELRSDLEAAGIAVLAPQGDLALADLPIITPEVRSTLGDPDTVLVLDVGGDDAGARALSQFRPFLPDADTAMAMVINDRRPWTGSVEGIERTIRRVEASARFRVTCLVSNPNLGDATTPDVVARGHALICEAGRALGLPVDTLVVTETIALLLPPEATLGVPVLRLRRRLFPPWQEDPSRSAPARDRRTHMMLLEIEERKAREAARAHGGTPNGEPH